MLSTDGVQQALPSTHRVCQPVTDIERHMRENRWWECRVCGARKGDRRICIRNHSRTCQQVIDNATRNVKPSSRRVRDNHSRPCHRNGAFAGRQQSTRCRSIRAGNCPRSGRMFIRTRSTGKWNQKSRGRSVAAAGSNCHGINRHERPECLVCTFRARRRRRETGKEMVTVDARPELAEGESQPATRKGEAARNGIGG